MNNVFFEPALEVWANIPQLLRTNPIKWTRDIWFSPFPVVTISQPVCETHIYRIEKKPQPKPILHNSWENKSTTCVTYCKLPPLVVVPKKKKWINLFNLQDACPNMVVPANPKENGVWGSPVLNGYSSWQKHGSDSKNPTRKGLETSCQSKDPRQKERMLPVPAEGQWRTHNLYALALYEAGISPLSMEEQCLFQVCVFSALVWPKVGILSLDTCFCQKFVNLKQILWSSIFHVCRKSTHGFTRMHRQ